MVPWLRSHRRNSSNPTSPLPPSIHSPDSPRIQPENRSPDAASFHSDAPSSRHRHPSFSEQARHQDRIDGTRTQNLDVPATGDSSYYQPSFPDKARPLSSSGPSNRPSNLVSHSNLSQQSLPPLVNNPAFTLNDHGSAPHSPVEERVQFYSAGGNARAGYYQNGSSDRLALDESAEGSKGPSRSRLNLLNPMSLLARRRSSQALVPKQEDMTMKNLSVPAIPDDFNPSIRGTKVHDFSAPRTVPNRRKVSSENAPHLAQDTSSSFAYDSSRRRSDVSKHSALLSSRDGRQGEHSPVFKEHFNDDRNALQIESKGYLHNMAAASLYPPHPVGDPPPVPAFARNLPLILPDERAEEARLAVVPETSRPGSEPSSSPARSRVSRRPAPPVPPQDVFTPALTVEESVLEVSRSGSPPDHSVSVSSSSSNARRRPSRQASSELPRRVASNASRFSFDVGGVEKLMEERHKQKEAEKKAQRHDSIADEYDEAEYGYDDFDDDGLEEEIPGLGADLLEEQIPGVNIDVKHDDDTRDINAIPDEEEEEEEMEEEIPEIGAGLEEEEVPGSDHVQLNHDEHLVKDEANLESRLEEPMAVKLHDFHFTPASTILSPTTTLRSSSATQPTPRDEDGHTIGYAFAQDSPTWNMRQPSTTQPKGLGILAGERLVPTEDTLESRRLGSVFLDEDDLYFDDGDIIGEPPEDRNSAFDEDIFDDETSHLHDRRIRQGQPPTPGDVNERELISSDTIESETDVDGGDDEFSTMDSAGYSAIAQAFSKPGAPLVRGSSGQAPPGSLKSVGPKPVGLTEDNLAAYHQALVAAANEAAAKGRFSRNNSVTHVSRVSEKLEDPGLTPDDSRVTSQEVVLEVPGVEDMPDDFDYDDELDDDAIIAEANAEALENDDEGFYGQEFGFYARARGNDESELVNGGYFGPRGIEGVSRSKSGRANFQEPNLTPITERSEWSARNSVLSLQTHGIPLSANTVPSPGIAQLVDMGSFDDDQMSFSALMKLRRGAWGGSNGSLHSSAGSQASGSPLAHVAQTGFGAPNMEPGNHRMSNSAYSLTGSGGIAESEEEDEGSSASPTITLANPIKAAWDRPPMVPQRTIVESSGISPSAPVAGRGHSRNSSATESISYVKERDADGAGRWILERRRTGDSGELELVGREILAGGRI